MNKELLAAFITLVSLLSGCTIVHNLKVDLERQNLCNVGYSTYCQ